MPSVPGIGRVDERRYPTADAVVAQRHRSQIEPHPVRRCELWPLLVINPDLFFDEFEIARVKLNSLLYKRCRQGHRPKSGNTHQCQLGSS